MSQHPSAPIGIFDSGVGGLTVARAVIDQLPFESVRYVGDTANAPYGPRPAEQIRELALAVADTLVASGVKMLVIACNSAAAAGVHELAARRYDIPVLEVITPAVRRALAVTHTRQVGVIGTSATVDSGAYPRTFGALADHGVAVHQQACPSFVDFVERGITAGRQITGLAQAYLDPLQSADIDTLVLGCTHYPLLTGVLQWVMGDRVTLVSSAEETAKDVLRVLTELDALAPAGSRDGSIGAGRHEFGATGDPVAFAALGSRFLGPEIDGAGHGRNPAAQ
ncbi:glutamate racemase [Nakamurella lactea]|uniref:glutamate racemase n=1 Tax=Nakamurella lactea TaxID=459515 RepID=UPI00048C22F3|nr:glutamate racemase [Nakamurella lactea]